MAKSREEIEEWLQGFGATGLARWEKRRKVWRTVRSSRFLAYGAFLLVGLIYLLSLDDVTGAMDVVQVIAILATVLIALESVLGLFGKGAPSGAFAMEVIDPAVEFLYPGFWYDPHDGLEDYEYLQSNLFLPGEEFRSAHGLKGEVGGEVVHVSEVQSLMQEMQRKDSPVRTYHRGWMLKTPQPGVGLEKVMIRARDSGGRRHRPGGSSFVEGPERLPYTLRAEMNDVEVDEEFGAHFAVYATSTDVAQALLTDEMIEALLAIREARDPDERMVFVSWYDDMLFIARRHDRPLMTPEQGKSLLEPGWVEAIQDDLEPIFGLVRAARKVEPVRDMEEMKAAQEAKEVEEVEEEVVEAQPQEQPQEKEPTDEDLQWDAVTRSDEW